MLLLVLIFVLAAFGLLLVALVTGTAAWAWISVAVSVAAAGALVYDWAQRRAAIRSGEGGDRTLGGAAPLARGPHEPPTAAIPVMGGAMMDPRTEVFPPVRSSTPARPPVADAPETVAFRPTTPPPGSPERPSSAQPDGATAGEQWSPRVTAGGRNRSDARSDAPKSPAGAPTGDPDSGKAEERTSRLGAAGAAMGRDAKGGSSDSAGPMGRRTPPARDQSDQWKPKQPAKAERPTADAGMPGDSYDDGKAKAAKASAAEGGKSDDRSGPDADSARTTAIPIADAMALAERSKRPEQEKPEQRATEQRKPERDGTEAPESPAQAEEPEAAAEPETDAAPEAAEAAETAETADTAPEQDAPPRGGPPEPEEERADAEATAIVAELDDEVLVIDEHPRFHLDGCRLLDGSETIPLPAKEAVEYGFTPCGTCSPVSTLAERNRAASSS